ncbi:MAG: hypothetical protein HC800_07280 [Phormidesmis sp. RL_2_1]|nr:hypothetical protein [Phormidesmis sp. RL_2_1]
MGILEFVFGKGTPKDDSQPKQAFYLSDDDAKTFGNIDYMRTAKTVKRTFAKKKGQEHLESVRQISALQQSELSNTGNSFAIGASTPTSSSTPASSGSSEVLKSQRPRRKTGTDMDMFRNMAKDIRK